MRKVGIACGVLTALLMSGCNSSDDSAQSSPVSITTSTSSDSFIGDGIYTGPNNSFMLVDSKRSHNNVLISVLDEGDFYIIGHTIATETQLKAYGVTYIDSNGHPTSDNNFTATANFTSDSTNIVGVYQGQNLVYSMNRSEDSLSLASIAGTHTNGDGSSWTINNDGSFTLNHSRGCTVSGSVKQQGAYYNMESATVSGCSNSAANGNYEGVMLTLKQNGVYGIYGILANSSSFLADAVQVTN